MCRAKWLGVTHKGVALKKKEVAPRVDNDQIVRRQILPQLVALSVMAQLMKEPRQGLNRIKLFLGKIYLNLSRHVTS